MHTKTPKVATVKLNFFPTAVTYGVSYLGRRKWMGHRIEGEKALDLSMMAPEHFYNQL